MSNIYKTIGSSDQQDFSPEEYTDLQYDYEVPDGTLIGSPGGVSSIHHHYTHGFYGRGNTSSDVYAGQGDAYIYGVKGNLYEPGQTSSYEMGMYPTPPDLQYWNNITPQSPSPYGSDMSPSVVPPTSFPFDPKGSSVYPQVPIMREGFSNPSQDDGNLQVLATPEKIAEAGKELKEVGKKMPRIVFVPKTSPLIILGLFLIVFMVFDLWSVGAQLFITQHFHDGKEPSWKSMLFYAIVATVIFGFLVWLSGAPIVEFETM